MEILYEKLEYIHQKLRSIELSESFYNLKERSLLFIKHVKSIGYIDNMDDYEKRKLGIFNQLNFFQLITGILIPILGVLHRDQLPFSIWITACLPACTSVIVLILNYINKYHAALLAYFILYPFFTCVVYMHGMNAGVGLHFILFGILSVFFLQDIGYMLFTVALSMVSYFILTVVLKDFIYQVEIENKTLYLFNQVLAILFIFYGLYLIKKENASYQFSILSKNRMLHKKNLEIKKQKEVIDQKARLLEIQKTELAELNSLKNKLFSVISHDLKSPMYALRNLFRNIHQYDLPPDEMKNMVPDVLNDLNFTISLMENLLQWSKSQMQADTVKAEEVNVSELIKEVVQLLHLQSEAKKVYIESKIDRPVYVFADKDMINLVLRNLVSNAIKFTPENGKIAIGVTNLSSFVEVYIQDSGTGISKEAMDKINSNSFYTTKGTSSESGTGLGLMLCKEFLAKNGGQMHIESEPGKGSIFSFTLPSS